ncbi:hypothetical protein KIN20_006309 [Parelaphostrongylus tenuis]|uniref:Uncharacterized protein n=1 Tax=Parelaphostrongylus tenuis TaxID=148309 RepID=A0AAD5MMT2_PARTN|nr:hypothetical protein KIN20_006309 [Parelaphostrongylus tenuis]
MEKSKVAKCVVIAGNGFNLYDHARCISGDNMESKCLDGQCVIHEPSEIVLVGMKPSQVASFSLINAFM